MMRTLGLLIALVVMIAVTLVAMHRVWVAGQGFLKVNRKFFRATDRSLLEFWLENADRRVRALVRGSVMGEAGFEVPGQIPCPAGDGRSAPPRFWRGSGCSTASRPDTVQARSAPADDRGDPDGGRRKRDPGVAPGRQGRMR